MNSLNIVRMGWLSSMVPLLYRDGQSSKVANEVLINIAETRNVSAFDGHSPRGRFWRSGPSRVSLKRTDVANM